MNDLTCNSICHLLCCPPVPSKIAAKLAFMPPPATYQLLNSDENGEIKFTFSLPAILNEAQYVPDNIDISTGVTRKGTEIAVLYMKINPLNKLTFLLSHGNAVDLGLMLNFMHDLGSKLNVNMMCYDYSGYGASSGKPMEKNLYADAECALDILRTRYNVPLNQIVLYGQSIGTVPTVHLATIHRVAAVVLHSPLMSGLRVAFPRLKRNYCFDVFSNLRRAPQIKSPTLIIHGTRDEVVHVSHGRRMCSALAENLLLDPLFIDGAGHNDCELFPQYLLRLLKLVSKELPQLHQLLTPTTLSAVGMMKSSWNTSSPVNTSSTDSATEISSSASLPWLTGLPSQHEQSSKDKCITPPVGESPKRLHSLFRKVDRCRFSTRLSTFSNKVFSYPLKSTQHSLVDVRQNDQHETNTVSACNNPRLSGSLSNELDRLSSTVLDDSIVAKKEANGNMLSSSVNVQSDQVGTFFNDNDFEQNSDNHSLKLPPPPPPPVLPASTASSDLFWTLHESHNSKILTLPSNLTDRDICKRGRLKKGMKLRGKTQTLPLDVNGLMSHYSKVPQVSVLSDNPDNHSDTEFSSQSSSSFSSTTHLSTSQRLMNGCSASENG